MDPTRSAARQRRSSESHAAVTPARWPHIGGHFRARELRFLRAVNRFTPPKLSFPDSEVSFISTEGRFLYPESSFAHTVASFVPSEVPFTHSEVSFISPELSFA